MEQLNPMLEYLQKQTLRPKKNWRQNKPVIFDNPIII